MSGGHQLYDDDHTGEVDRRLPGVRCSSVIPRDEGSERGKWRTERAKLQDKGVTWVSVEGKGTPYGIFQDKERRERLRLVHEVFLRFVTQERCTTARERKENTLGQGVK